MLEFESSASCSISQIGHMDRTIYAYLNTLGKDEIWKLVNDAVSFFLSCINLNVYLGIPAGKLL